VGLGQDEEEPLLAGDVCLQRDGTYVATTRLRGYREVKLDGSASVSTIE
jgi:hypothetical protein